MPIFDESFWTSDGRHLNKPALNCLTQDAALYRTLLLQICEDISYNKHKIWMTGAAQATSKFNAFFDLAIAEHVELAVTPEYSCPWDVISGLIKNGRLPTTNNLWIIGAQSITANELMDFAAEHQEMTWIFEQELVVQHKGDGQFFDPVCLVMNTTDHDGQLRKVIVVQFKNLFFGGGDFIWERDNLIRGERFYIISNRIASTKLLTQICSDALLNINFNEVNEGYFLNSPLLLIHIQLNQRPFQTNYKNYRNSLFSSGGKESNKEVICLNWARGVNITDHPNWNVYGGSGIYMKTEKLDLSNERLNGNHLLGLYYNNWYERRSHIYFFGYREHVYLIRNTKTSQAAADPAQLARTGPEVVRLFSWNAGWQLSNSADDGFVTLCGELYNDIGDLTCLAANLNPLDVERMLELSLGSLDPSDSWYKPGKLTTIRIADDEFNNRTNFTDDPANEQRERRINRLMHFGVLKNIIITDAARMPFGLKDAQINFDNTLSPEKRYLLNLHSQSHSLRKGTGIYLGLAPINKAKSVRDRVVSLFKEDQQGKQVIVWYQTQSGNIVELAQGRRPDISENTRVQSNSYKKTVD